MNSFFIPQLGSQIYTMGGMTTHLNLLADRPGEYPGFSANYSGAGFAEMRFVAKAVPPADFDAWVERGARRRAGARRGRLRRTGKAEPGRAAGELRRGRARPVPAHRRRDARRSRKRAGSAQSRHGSAMRHGGN